MLPKDFKFSQKWQNFNKSGHTEILKVAQF